MEVTIATIVVVTTREGVIVVDTITRTAVAAAAATRIMLQEGKISTQTLAQAKLYIQRGENRSDYRTEQIKE